MGHVDRLVKDGTVAVLVSPGYGAGWASWNDQHKEFLAMDRGLVELAVRGATEDDVKAYLKSNGIDDVYTGGWEQIKVQWLSLGTSFVINEYDGYESIEELGMIDFMVA